MIRQPLLRPPNKCFLPRHCRGKSDTLVDIIERSYFLLAVPSSLSFQLLEASRTSLLQLDPPLFVEFILFSRNRSCVIGNYRNGSGKY